MRAADTHITLRDFVIDFYDVEEPVDNDTLRDVLRAHGQPHVKDASLQMVGVVITFDVKLVGLNGRDCPVEWSLLDGRTYQPFDQPYLRGQRAMPHSAVKARADEDTLSMPIWIPRPPGAGSFTVMLEIFDDESPGGRLPLDVEVSEPFS